jgi:hypothetical protein
VPTPSQHFENLGILPASRKVAVRWLPGTIQRMFANPVYKGKMELNRWQQTKGKRRDPRTGLYRDYTTLRPRPVEQRTSIDSPAIVSEELWAVAHARRERNKADAPRNNRHIERTLLRGVGYCGYCQSKLYSYTDKRRDGGAGRTYYICSHQPVRFKHPEAPDACPAGYYTLRTDLVDADVWAKVVAIFEQPDKLKAAVAAYHAEAADRAEAEAAEMASWEEELDKYKRKRTNLLRALEDAADDDERGEIEARKAEVSKTIQKVQRRIEATLAARAGREEYEEQMDELLAWMEDYRTHTLLRRGELPYEQKRRALDLLGTVVFIYKKDDPREDGNPWEVAFDLGGQHSDSRLRMLLLMAHRASR